MRFKIAIKKTLLTIITLLLLISNASAFDINATSYPVYRLYDASSGSHYFTIDSDKYDRCQNTLGYKPEGIVWYTHRNSDVVYDIYNWITKDHLYTNNSEEAAQLDDIGGWGILQNEGFWSGGSLPVYRLYSPSAKKHLFTADLNEYNTLPAYGWNQEGIAFFVYPNFESAQF